MQAYLKNIINNNAHNSRILYSTSDKCLNNFSTSVPDDFIPTVNCEDVIVYFYNRIMTVRDNVPVITNAPHTLPPSQFAIFTNCTRVSADDLSIILLDISVTFDSIDRDI